MSRNRGFTLIEMLIALVLTGLLAVVITAGLNIGVRSWQALDRFQERDSAYYLAQYTVRRLLADMRPQRIRDQDGVNQAAFYGREKVMAFVAPLQPYETGQTLHWIVLRAEMTDTGERLALYHEPFRLEDEEDEQTNRSRLQLSWETLVDEMLVQGEPQYIYEGEQGEIFFQYQLLDDAQQPVWEAEWTASTKIPQLILLRFESEQQEAREMLVLPRVNAYGFRQVL